jgi:transcription factor IIIB subunit 2
MKRDWIHVGRRPAGICGAALVVAARVHGIDLSLKDVTNAVRVCCATLTQR